MGDRHIVGIKKPEHVVAGDVTKDYNGEIGIVREVAQFGTPQYYKLFGEDNEIEGFVDKGDWVLSVEGKEYGLDGGYGHCTFSYGYNGAYVEDIISENGEDQQVPMMSIKESLSQLMVISLMILVGTIVLIGLSLIF